ncbi:cytochrome P450 4c21-like isoform X2 [Planococcus citri]|uniref:cytochrome P450 4c21-like isoform X2 n=1 Tax=Planococcus citri TaxID=170843 RepID=UPI0031F9A5CA
MIIVYTVIVIILFVLFYKIKNKRAHELLKQFPCYPTYPLIGNAYMLHRLNDGLLLSLERLLAPYDRLLFWLGPVPALILKKYDDIMTVLNQTQDRDTMNLLEEWIGVGILNAKFDDWKKSRKMLSPAFSSEMLVRYADVFHEKASILVDELKGPADRGEIVNAWDYVMNTNLETVLANTLGTSIEKTGKDAKNYCSVLHKTFQNLTTRVISPWLHPGFIYKIYLKLIGQMNTIKILNDLPEEAIEEKLNNVRNTKKAQEYVDDSPNSIIDLLIEKSAKETSFTKTRIRDEAVQLILVGSETTALNVCFTLLALAIHQDIQQKVYEEIVQVMPEKDTLDTDDCINQLKYLEQCVKETSRIYSQSVLVIRRTHKDCTLKDNKIIPKNTLVAAAIHFSHFDPELYKNPSVYDPEHFNDEAVAKRPKGSELVFGYGPRICIGAKYSIISSKMQLAHIIRNYHLSTNIKEITKNDLNADLCLRSKIGYPIKFTSRQKAK